MMISDLLMREPVEQMKWVFKVANEIQEQDKKALISFFLTTIFMLLPLAGGLVGSAELDCVGC